MRRAFLTVTEEHTEIVTFCHWRTNSPRPVGIASEASVWIQLSRYPRNIRRAVVEDSSVVGIREGTVDWIRDILIC